MPIPIDTDLYEQAKRIVYPKYKKPSAYRSGALVKKYKELGGRYQDDGEPRLRRWFNEKWQDIGQQTYPVFRPTVRVNDKTPLTISEIDPVHARKQIRLKQRIKGTRNLPPFQPRSFDSS